MAQTKDISHHKSGSATTAGVGKTTGDFAAIRSGSGTTFSNNNILKDITAGVILVGSKSPGGDTTIAFQNYRYMLRFDIPNNIIKITGATLTLPSLKIFNNLGVVESGTNRAYLQKAKTVSASILDLSGGVVNSNYTASYQSINTASMVTYDDTSGITVPDSNGTNVKTPLNAAAVSNLNKVIGSNFDMALMEYEHDYNNSGSFTYAAFGAARYGFRTATSSISLTITGSGGGKVKITSGKVILSSGGVKITESQI
jgi:hypothetical protein